MKRWYGREHNQCHLLVSSIWWSGSLSWSFLLMINDLEPAVLRIVLLLCMRKFILWVCRQADCSNALSCRMLVCLLCTPLYTSWIVDCDDHCYESKWNAWVGLFAWYFTLRKKLIITFMLRIDVTVQHTSWVTCHTHLYELLHCCWFDCWEFVDSRVYSSWEKYISGIIIPAPNRRQDLSLRSPLPHMSLSGHTDHRDSHSLRSSRSLSQTSLRLVDSTHTPTGRER